MPYGSLQPATARLAAATGSYIQQAIALDPSYALAYVRLADAYRSALAGDMPATELLPKAKEAAQKAVEIDDSLADAHAELGFIIFWYDWDWVAAENQFNRDLEIDPNSADTHLFSREMLALVFRDNGYTVILAEDGLRGLEMARVERPSLIITDINMPGMDAR